MALGTQVLTMMTWNSVFTWMKTAKIDLTDPDTRKERGHANANDDDIQDYIQMLQLRVIEYYNRYDVASGALFKSYAHSGLVRDIKEKKSGDIPYDDIKIAAELRELKRVLEDDYGAYVNEATIAEAYARKHVGKKGIRPARVKKLLGMSLDRQALSIDMNVTGEDGDQMALGDILSLSDGGSSDWLSVDISGMKSLSEYYFPPETRVLQKEKDDEFRERVLRSVRTLADPQTCISVTELFLDNIETLHHIATINVNQRMIEADRKENRRFLPMPDPYDPANYLFVSEFCFEGAAKEKKRRSEVLQEENVLYQNYIEKEYLSQAGCTAKFAKKQAAEIFLMIRRAVNGTPSDGRVIDDGFSGIADAGMDFGSLVNDLMQEDNNDFFFD